jgi:hypothetical protein
MMSRWPPWLENSGQRPELMIADSCQASAATHSLMLHRLQLPPSLLVLLLLLLLLLMLLVLLLLLLFLLLLKLLRCSSLAC